MQPGKRRLIDGSTGEVMLVAVQRPRRQHIGGFFMADQTGFRRLAHMDLTKTTRRVLDLLFAELDFDNYIAVSQAELARELDLPRQNINRAVGELLEHGVIVRGPRVGNVFTYRLDPNFGWKGRASRRTEALERAAKAGISVIDGGGDPWAEIHDEDQEQGQ